MLINIDTKNKSAYNNMTDLFSVRITYTKQRSWSLKRKREICETKLLHKIRVDKCNLSIILH